MPEGGFNSGAATMTPQSADRGRAQGSRSRSAPGKFYWQLEQVLCDNYEDAWFWWEATVVAYRKTSSGWDQEDRSNTRKPGFGAHPLWFKDGKALSPDSRTATDRAP